MDAVDQWKFSPFKSINASIAKLAAKDSRCYHLFILRLCYVWHGSNFGSNRRDLVYHKEWSAMESFDMPIFGYSRILVLYRSKAGLCPRRYVFPASSQRKEGVEGARDN